MRIVLKAKHLHFQDFIFAPAGNSLTIGTPVDSINLAKNERNMISNNNNNNNNNNANNIRTPCEDRRESRSVVTDWKTTVALLRLAFCYSLCFQRTYAHLVKIEGNHEVWSQIEWKDHGRIAEISFLLFLLLNNY